MMKIGIDFRLANASHRGMARYCREIVRKLLKIDRSNYYILFIDREPGIQLENTNNYRFRYVQTRNFILGEQIIMPILLYKEKCDVFWSPYNTFPMCIPSRTKLAVTIHDLIYLYRMPHGIKLYQRIGMLYRRFVVKHFFHRINLCFTVSRFSRREIYRYLDSRMEAVVTYNCVETFVKLLDNIVPSKDFLCENYFFTLSGDAPSKNLNTLLNVFERYFPDQKLIVAGVSGQSNFRKRQSKQIQILDEGISDDLLVQYYLGCRCFLFCSKFEGFGIPVIEAAICGKPIIASNTTSIPEILNGKGWLVEPTEESIRDAISDFLQGDKTMDCDYAESIKKFADWTMTAETVLDSLTKFCQKKN